MSNPHLYHINIPNILDNELPRGKNGRKKKFILLNLDTRLPTYVFTLNEKIDTFETIQYKSDTVEQLNNVGLHIYLEEPLCSYNSEKGYYTKQFYEEFVGDESPNHLRAKELDSILTLIDNNKLTNVKVYTCDYDVEKYYPFYINKMTLITDDIFVKRYFHSQHRPPLLTKTKGPFKKKFINLNWRYTSPRHLLATYLNEKDSYLSWPHKKSFRYLKEHVWTDDETIDKLEDSAMILYHKSPMTLDISINQTDSDDEKYQYPQNPSEGHDYRGMGYYKNLMLPALYNDSFVAIVSESRFAQPTANLSEKTLQVILNKKPFILLAPPFTLKYLKEDFGFKTFNKFWDESYDEEVIHIERMKKIFSIIDDIQNKPISELQDIYTQMKEIIDHNHRQLMTKLND
tara:strand:- start:49 stop:1251 length:1203 start_codon:yes stop_codon:yes gene_type:complete